MKMIINTSEKNRDVHRRFEDFLRQKDLKLTRQRAAILDAFLCLDDHVSAEELYHEILHHDPGIGQATVFRTMKLIAESGIAAEMSTGGRTVRYEHSLGGGHHDHIQCLGCGTVFEFRNEEIERLQVETCARMGIRLVRHRMNLYGYCAVCEAAARKGTSHEQQ